ncbi:MAG: sel1 repeat family protein, partial [Alphaproteobacteria bacterium]|nr:sel1 repeat family protein [Alphaproteobacteria bacterium]
RAGELGNEKAFLHLGIIHSMGNGVKKDIKKAISYYEKGEKLTEPGCLTNLGILYLDGEGIGKNSKKAIGYLEKAEKLKDPRAYFNLGKVYYLGTGIPKNTKKGISYLEQGRNLKNLECTIYLAALYGTGSNDILQNPKIAEQYFEEAVDLGYSGDFSPLMQIYNRNGTYGNEKIKYIEKAAEKNDTTALNLLGMHYEKKGDLDKALFYIKKTKNLGDPDTFYNLAIIYYKKKDIKEAIQYAEKGADKGHSYACKFLVTLFLNNDYIPQDVKKATQYFEKAKKEGDIKESEGLKRFLEFKDLENRESFYNLAEIYYKKEDIKKAIHYAEKAADEGNSDACKFLVELFLKNDYIPQDVERATQYFEQAKKEGHINASKGLQRLLEFKFMQLYNLSKEKKYILKHF